MSILLARNVGYDLAGLRIDHLRVGGPWNIEQMGLGIDGEIVPSALSADLKRIYDLPKRLCDHRVATRQQKNKPDGRRGSFHSHLFDFSRSRTTMIASQ